MKMENHHSVTVDSTIYDYLSSKRIGFESRSDVLRRLLKLPPKEEKRGRPRGGKNKVKSNGEAN